jgi:hypothetical protein
MTGLPKAKLVCNRCIMCTASTRLTRTAKRKREEDQQKQDKINNGISKYFGAKTAAKAPKAKVWPACTRSEFRRD